MSQSVEDMQLEKAYQYAGTLLQTWLPPSATDEEYKDMKPNCPIPGCKSYIPYISVSRQTHTITSMGLHLLSIHHRQEREFVKPKNPRKTWNMPIADFCSLFPPDPTESSTSVKRKRPLSEEQELDALVSKRQRLLRELKETNAQISSLAREKKQE